MTNLQPRCPECASGSFETERLEDFRYALKIKAKFTCRKCGHAWNGGVSNQYLKHDARQYQKKHGCTFQKARMQIEAHYMMMDRKRRPQKDEGPKKEEAQAKIPKHIKKMMDFAYVYEGLPDGAFFAIAEEQGIYPEDWAEMADWQSKNSDWKKRAGGPEVPTQPTEQKNEPTR